MKRYEVFPGHAGSPLQMAEFEPSPLGDRQVAVAIKAVSLNYRDILVTQNTYFCPITDGLVPCSDGAGEVVAVGRAVRGLKVGDRVASLFFPNWQSGRADGNSFAGALGAEGGGVLTEQFIAEESGLIKLPDSISYREAATFSCAALTAWNSLFEAGDHKPGQTVLLLGTGGVSIYALQFAKAAGATVIITSSDDSKLAHAKELGADHGIVQEGDVLRGIVRFDNVRKSYGDTQILKGVSFTVKPGQVVALIGRSGSGILPDQVLESNGSLRRSANSCRAASRAGEEQAGKRIARIAVSAIETGQNRAGADNASQRDLPFGTSSDVVDRLTDVASCRRDLPSDLIDAANGLSVLEAELEDQQTKTATRETTPVHVRRVGRQAAGVDLVGATQHVHVRLSPSLSAVGRSHLSS